MRKVPGHLVARIIGKGGETIKALQEETGAKIVIIQDSKVVNFAHNRLLIIISIQDNSGISQTHESRPCPQEFQEEKPLKITGPPDKVEFAKQRVEQVSMIIRIHIVRSVVIEQTLNWYT